MDREVYLWSSDSYSTVDGIEYTVEKGYQHFEREAECRLVIVGVSGEIVTKIPCFYCDHQHFSDTNRYLEYYKLWFTNYLMLNFPAMPPSSAEEISENIKSTVQSANAQNGHNCHDQKEALTAIYGVDIIIHSMDNEDRALFRNKPATVESVEELVLSMKYDEFEIETDHQCVICMDEIQTRKISLTMPCSHVFHRDCLVQWLQTSHVCPLCRYQMPTDVD